MRTLGCRVVVILALSLCLFSQTASPAMAACRFTTGGDGLRLSVIVTSDPGALLTVDWGDGQATTRPEERAGRMRIDHDYQAGGDYTVQITEIGAGGQGCSLGMEITVPYEGGRDAESQIILSGGDPPPRPEVARVVEVRPVSDPPARPDDASAGPPARGFGDFLRDLFRTFVGN